MNSLSSGREVGLTLLKITKTKTFDEIVKTVIRQ